MLSNLLYGLFLLWLENLVIKHNIFNQTIAFRNRSVDNILIIYDHTNFPPTHTDTKPIQLYQQ